jgi:hypothetical protein
MHSPYNNRVNFTIKTIKNDQILHFTSLVIKKEYVKCKTYFWYIIVNKNKFYLFLSSQRLFLPTLFSAFVRPRYPNRNNEEKIIEINMI